MSRSRDVAENQIKDFEMPAAPDGRIQASVRAEALEISRFEGEGGAAGPESERDLFCDLPRGSHSSASVRKLKGDAL